MTSKSSQTPARGGLKFSFATRGKNVLRRAGGALNRLADRLTVPPALSAEDRALLARNRELRGRHAGQRCFVLANGPSLAAQDISPLGGEITFVGNSFWKHPLVGPWQPTYYCLADPIYFDGSEAMSEFFDALNSRVRDSVFLARLAGHQTVRERGLLPEDKTYYVSFYSSLGDSPLGDIDLSGRVLAPGNMGLFCIMAALYMGCSPIYLMGFDHDWLAQPRETQHFYEGHAGLEKHPNYRPDLLAERGYKTMMESQLKLWRAHELLRDFARRRGASIYNAGHGGFLDVYPRINYRDLIQPGGPEAVNQEQTVGANR